jgi:hypothetical protein
VAESGGHGGGFGYWELFTGREGERPGIGKKGRKGLRGIERRLQEVALVA